LPAVVNSLIGSIQEIHGKRVLSKLRLLNQSKAIVIRDGEKTSLVAEDIVLDDIVLLSAGDQCLADSIVKEGEIRVDESMLTGESDPVIKKEGDVVYAGSSIIVGSSIVQVQKVGDDTYASSLSSKVKELPILERKLYDSAKKLLEDEIAFALGKTSKEIEAEIHTKLEPPGAAPKIKHTMILDDDEDDDLMDDLSEGNGRRNQDDSDEADDASDEMDSDDDFDDEDDSF
jgi:hypothetical protein